MLNFDLIQELLLIASVNSAICLAFIQKIKKHIHCSKCVPYYSFSINLVLAILFCVSFTKIRLPMSLWVGLFSYIGADTLYKTLEGKLARHSSLVPKDHVENQENPVVELEEITYE